MNPAESAKYRERLLSLRDQLRQDIQASIEAIEEEGHPPGEDTKEPSEGLDKELVLEQNEETLYHAVNAALQRIEEGTYGQCAACGKEIPAERLDALPYTAYCIECERQQESAAAG